VATRTEQKLAYLQETKSDIRNALIEKGQGVTDTDTFRSYADKIRAIESGGGDVIVGGNIPAGVYLSAADEYEQSAQHRRFMLNGNLYYAGTNSTASGYLNVIKKWNGTTWETVLESTSTTAGINDTKVDGTNWRGVEIDGKFYFAESRSCAAFDGATLTVLPDIPKTESTCFKWNGKLYVYTGSGYTLYEWDNDNSAWIAMTTHKYAYFAFVLNDDLYLVNSSGVCRYDNGSLTLVCTAPSNSTRFFVKDGAVYGYYMNKFYKFDLSSGTHTQIGAIPSFSYLYWSYGTSEIGFNGVTNYTPNSKCPYFVVNIVEPSE
jgi:hypothetical protein